MTNWEKFFMEVGGDYLHPTYGGETYRNVSIDELYTVFKARFLDEMKDDLSRYGSDNLEQRESIR